MIRRTYFLHIKYVSESIYAYILITFLNKYLYFYLNYFSKVIFPTLLNEIQQSLSINGRPW